MKLSWTAISMVEAMLLSRVSLGHKDLCQNWYLGSLIDFGSGLDFSPQMVALNIEFVLVYLTSNSFTFDQVCHYSLSFRVWQRSILVVLTSIFRGQHCGDVEMPERCSAATPPATTSVPRMNDHCLLLVVGILYIKSTICWQSQNALRSLTAVAMASNSSEIIDSRVDNSERQSTLQEEALSDFSPEWCQNLLNDPTYQQLGASTRKLGPPGTTSNNFMAKTIFTPTTVRAIRYLYRPASLRPSNSSSGILGGDLVALVSVGTELCSHPDVLHGGVNTILVDEIAGSLAMKEAPPGTSMMAVNFNVNLRKSVKTPGLILGRAWRERKEEGRKWWVK
jgi:acyl-coenzyme A thioesterase THEM4